MALFSENGDKLAEVFKKRRLRDIGVFKYYFRLLAGNNKIIAQSEPYNRAADARDTVDVLARRFASNGGGTYWVKA